MIKCPYCNQQFKNKGIRGHITKMHPDQPNPYDKPDTIVESQPEKSSLILLPDEDKPPAKINNLPQSWKAVRKAKHLEQFGNYIHKTVTDIDGNRVWMMEHRHIMEMHLGRKLTPSEEVHHINLKRDDNRLENLILVSHEEHEKIHNRVIPKPNGLSNQAIEGMPKDEIVVEQSQSAGDELGQFVHQTSSIRSDFKPTEVITPSPAPLHSESKLQNSEQVPKMSVSNEPEPVPNSDGKKVNESPIVQNKVAKLGGLLHRKPKEKKEPKLPKAEEPIKKSETAKRPPMEKDPESLISLMLSIPTWILILSVPSFLLLYYERIILWLETDEIGTLIMWVIQNPKETASVIMLVMFALLTILGIAVFYKVVWRMAFKDFQIKYASPRFLAHGDLEDDTAESVDVYGGARRVFIPASYEGRVYASIGFGFWDRLYRKKFNVEQPDKITLYVHRTWKPVNPFRPLSSCDKIYLNNTNDGEPIYKDGKFKTTVIATRMVRMSENNSIVYWLDDGAYPQEKFTSKWYNDIHSKMLDNGLKKVSKGSLVNPDIQQDQMRRNMLWLPPQDIEAEKQLLELKKKKEMKGVQ